MEHLFYKSANNSTFYTLGQSGLIVSVQWTIDTDGIQEGWRVRLYIDGAEEYLPDPRQSSDNVWFNVGNHTCIIKLFYYNILGQEVFVKQDQIVINISPGYQVGLANNFNGGQMKIDYWTYDLPSAAGYLFYFAPGNHTLSGIDGQTGSDGYKRIWSHWEEDDGSLTTYNIDNVVFINQDGLGFRAYYGIQPKTPLNFHSTTSTGNVQLAWTENTGPTSPNIKFYEIGRHIFDNGGWIVIGNTRNTSFTDTEFSITNPLWATHTAEYRVRAKSTEDVYSEYSSIVTSVQLL